MASSYRIIDIRPQYGNSGDKIRLDWNGNNGGLIYMTVQNASGSFISPKRLRFDLQRKQDGVWYYESHWWFDYGGRFGYTFNRTFYNTWANYQYRIIVKEYETGKFLGQSYTINN